MKTTKQHYELFKKECDYWIDKFKINDWRVDYMMEDLDNNIAQCDRNLFARTVKISLNTELGVEDIKLLKDTAKHEIIHLLIGELAVMAKDRYIRQDELYSAEEALTRKLEKIINIIK